jgi:hypothetical protein
VICNAGTLVVIAILRFAVALCDGEVESATLTVNDDVPAVVGVPLICPELLSVKPVGREPVTDQA